MRGRPGAGRLHPAVLRRRRGAGPHHAGVRLGREPRLPGLRRADVGRRAQHLADRRADRPLWRPPRGGAGRRGHGRRQPDAALGAPLLAVLRPGGAPGGLRLVGARLHPHRGGTVRPQARPGHGPVRRRRFDPQPVDARGHGPAGDRGRLARRLHGDRRGPAGAGAPALPRAGRRPGGRLLVCPLEPARHPLGRGADGPRGGARPGVLDHRGLGLGHRGHRRRRPDQLRCGHRHQGLRPGRDATRRADHHDGHPGRGDLCGPGAGPDPLAQGRGV